MHMAPKKVTPFKKPKPRPKTKFTPSPIIPPKLGGLVNDLHRLNGSWGSFLFDFNKLEADVKAVSNLVESLEKTIVG